MFNFKVGDRVQLIGRPYNMDRVSVPIGSIGYIIEINRSQFIRVEFIGYECNKNCWLLQLRVIISREIMQMAFDFGEVA